MTDVDLIVESGWENTELVPPSLLAVNTSKTDQARTAGNLSNSALRINHGRGAVILVFDLACAFA